MKEHSSYAAGLLATVFLAGCFFSPAPQLERYREVKSLMGTIVQVDVCHPPQDTVQREAAYAAVWERLEDISWRMNVFDERSDVAKINRSHRRPVRVGADTVYVISRARYFSQLTQGVFDITVWPLIDLWKQAAADGRLPAQDTIVRTRQAVGVDKIIIRDDGLVETTDPRTQVDLGGIAKGYAIDEAARLLREHGYTQFFIDAGGDNYVGGRNCQGRLWRIGIRDPLDRSRIIDVVELQDAAVATSGDYAQFFEINGKHWSHIINPITGYPQERIVSASVIAPDATSADALATASTILDPQQSQALVDSLGEQYGSFVVRLEGESPRHYRSRYYRQRETGR